MDDTTRKLLKFVQYEHQDVLDAIGGQLPTKEARTEANRLLEGFYEVIANGKSPGDAVPEYQFAATIYAALAVAHSMKEVSLLTLKRQAQLN